jgi:hypothetical protein
MDDAVCPNRQISTTSQATIYDRLQLDKLWQPNEYRNMISDAGYEVEVLEDLTPHCEKSYEWLQESALKNGEIALAESYAGTIAGIRKQDFGWFNFIAKRTYFGAYYDKQLPVYRRCWGEEARIGFGWFGDGSAKEGACSREGFHAAQLAQVARLAGLGGFDRDSIVLDLGCGSGVNCFYLAQRYR